MQEQVAPLALLATLGAGTFLYRHYAQPTLHEEVKARAVGRRPGLALLMTRFAVALSPEEWRALLNAVDEIVVLDERGGPSAQWKISRRTVAAMALAQKACTGVGDPALLSDAVFRQRTAAAEELLPQLRGHLDDLLHNHLLRCGSS